MAIDVRICSHLAGLYEENFRWGHIPPEARRDALKTVAVVEKQPSPIEENRPAELERDGAPEIRFRYHLGDATIPKAYKW